MTVLAIVFMTASLVAVISLTAWCYYKVLVTPSREGD